MAGHHIEHEATEELLEVAVDPIPGSAAVAGDGFRDLRVAGRLIVSLADEGQRGRIERASTRWPVEAAGGESAVALGQLEQIAGGDIDAGPDGEPVQDLFPRPDVPGVVPRRELGDPEAAIVGAEVRLRPRAPERASWSDQQGHLLVLFTGREPLPSLRPLGVL